MHSRSILTLPQLIEWIRNTIILFVHPKQLLPSISFEEDPDHDENEKIQLYKCTFVFRILFAFRMFFNSPIFFSLCY